MTLFVPGRLVRLVFFTLSAGCAGLISAEATAMTLCFLVIVAACCRGPIRVDLVFAGIAAFAARYSGGSLDGFKSALLIILPLFIALGGLYVMVRSAFRPRNYEIDSRRRHHW